MDYRQSETVKLTRKELYEQITAISRSDNRFRNPAFRRWLQIGRSILQCLFVAG